MIVMYLMLFFVDLEILNVSFDYGYSLGTSCGYT